MTTTTHASREAWLEARKEGHGVGASTVGAILGLSTFSSPWDVWAAAHMPEAYTPPEGDQLLRGLALEPHLLNVYAERYGMARVRWHDNTISRHARVPWVRCSLDGEAWERDTGEHGLVETKVLRAAPWPGWSVLPDEVRPGEHKAYDIAPRPAYLVQAQWQMLATGAPWCDLAILEVGHDIVGIFDAVLATEMPAALRDELIAKAVASVAHRVRRCRIHADRGLQRHIVGRVRAWRQRHLVEGIEPTADGSARRWYARGAAEGDGAELALDVDHPLEVAGHYLWHLRAKLRALTSAKDAAEARIAKAMGTRPKVATSAGVLAWQKSGRGHSLKLKQWAPRETAPEMPAALPALEDT